MKNTNVSSYADLYCSHEEADTRMLHHAKHADTEFGRKNTKGRTIVKSLLPGYGISPNSL
jgi:hypothetical protein